MSRLFERSQLSPTQQEVILEAYAKWKKDQPLYLLHQQLSAQLGIRPRKIRDFLKGYSNGKKNNNRRKKRRKRLKIVQRHKLG